MTTLELCKKSKKSLEKARKLNRQSLQIAEAGAETIQRSRELLQSLTSFKPTFKGNAS